MAEVGRLVDEAKGGLVVALPEAKVAADVAARRADEEPEATVEQLESELEAFRLVGIPLLPAPDPEPELEVEAEVDEPEVEPEPEPEPEPAIVEERRSSSVRVFRNRREPAVVLDLPEAELVPVEPPDPVEEVTVVPVDAVDSVDAVDPAPEADPVPEPASEPDPEPEPVVQAEEHRDGAPEPERLDAGAVDALFSRLRTAREPEPEPDAEPDAVVEPEPVVEEPPRPDALARRDELLAGPAAALLRASKRLLADEQNAVLDALRRGGVSPAAVAEAGDLERRWAAAAEADLAAAAVAGVGFVTGEPRDPPPLADVAAELARAVAGPLGERLVAAVERSDGHHDLAADGVRAVCREWRARRLSDAVEHAARAAFGRGVLAAAERDGARLCWVVDDGGTPCPDAEDNALAGAVAAGDAFPTGHRHPPAHPGCRCVLAVVP